MEILQHAWGHTVKLGAVKRELEGALAWGSAFIGVEDGGLGICQACSLLGSLKPNLKPGEGKDKWPRKSLTKSTKS